MTSSFSRFGGVSVVIQEFREKTGFPDYQDKSISAVRQNHVKQRHGMVAGYWSENGCFFSTPTFGAVFKQLSVKAPVI